MGPLIWVLARLKYVMSARVPISVGNVPLIPVPRSQSVSVEDKIAWISRVMGRVYLVQEKWFENSLRAVKLEISVGIVPVMCDIPLNPKYSAPKSLITTNNTMFTTN